MHNNDYHAAYSMRNYVQTVGTYFIMSYVLLKQKRTYWLAYYCAYCCAICAYCLCNVICRKLRLGEKRHCHSWLVSIKLMRQLAGFTFYRAWPCTTAIPTRTRSTHCTLYHCHLAVCPWFRLFKRIHKNLDRPTQNASSKMRSLFTTSTRRISAYLR